VVRRLQPEADEVVRAGMRFCLPKQALDRLLWGGSRPRGWRHPTPHFALRAIGAELVRLRERTPGGACTGLAPFGREPAGADPQGRAGHSVIAVLSIRGGGARARRPIAGGLGSRPTGLA
jgi:hypothetical protein